MVPLDTNRAVFLTALLMLASVRGQECYPPGNVNYDGLVDIFDIVLTVDCIVESECGDCSDANGDGITDVSDIILQTELILVPPSCLYPTLTQIPVGNPLTIPSGEPYVGGDPDVIYDDDSGLYKVWHTAYRNQILGIGYGESEDGLSWNIEMDGSWPHVLQPTEDSWDKDGLETVSVMKKDGQYLIWYLGYPCYLGDDEPGRIKCIGFAESEDGINWTKHPEPVLVPTEDWEVPRLYGYWEDGEYYETWRGGLQEPSVLWDDVENLFKMWYEGFTVDTLTIYEDGEESTIIRMVHQIGYAESTDGIDWIKHPDNPVFSPTFGDGSYPWEEWYFTGHTNVLFDPNQGYHLYYFANHSIGHAFSLDGIYWKRNPNNPVLLGSPNGDVFMSFAGPSSLIEGEQIKMFLMHSVPGAQYYWDGGMYLGITTGFCQE